MSYFATVTSINSEPSPLISKGLKCKNNAIRDNEQVYYQAAKDNLILRQQQRITSPIFQNTGLINNNDLPIKSTVKTTENSNKPSQIFDFTQDRREINFKPHQVKIAEPGSKSDQVYKQHMKSVNQGKKENNPITYGDPRSNYVKTQTGIQPRNQIPSLV